MDIDWTQIRGAMARIEQELKKAQKAVDSTDAELVRDWPEVRRADLEAAFPRWRTEYGSDWTRDFMEKRIGRPNYRFQRTTKTYRIAPAVMRALNLGAPPGPESERRPP
jgi:hypothetical protein